MSAAALTKPGLLHKASGAVISSCGQYRYWLHRSWTFGNGWTTFIMLNPSTADATKDDPTIRRCIKFAQAWGSQHLAVVNLFAWRATDPRELAKIADPIGDETHAYVTLACELAEQGEPDSQKRVVCAWGASPYVQANHVQTVLGWAEAAGSETWCLGRTKSNAPRHPLYVAAATSLERFP